jgi:hypothetical protein
MRKIKFTSTLFIVLFVYSCGSPEPAVGGGTLGKSAEIELFSEQDITIQYLDSITNLAEFKVEAKSKEWWVEGGFSFLTYWLFNYGGYDYCISLNKANNSLMVRAIKKNSEWVFASAFKERDHEKAEKALNYLMLNYTTL